MARAIKSRTSGRNSVNRQDRSKPLGGGAAWVIRPAHGLQAVESRALRKLDWVIHGFSTRPGGASMLEGKPALNLGSTEWDERERVGANREKFLEALGAGEEPLVTLRQFHSYVIYVAAAPPAEAPKAD